MRIALVVYDGVLTSECEAFTSVLSLMTDATVESVGAHDGSYSGPGGHHAVDRRFDEVGDDVDVVVVPGGLGCERAADDEDLRRFLHRMERSARYVAASSTGSVVLASAGLLHGEPAATHWLAGDLLRRYGSEADTRRMVMTGNVITCEGRLSAVDAAFALVERLEGSAAVDRIRTTLIERGQPLFHEPSRLDRLRAWVRDLFGVAESGSSERASAPAEPPVTPLSVMVELIDDDDDARRLRRSSRQRRRR